jgi:hypothetical protein
VLEVDPRLGRVDGRDVQQQVDLAFHLGERAIDFGYLHPLTFPIAP